MALKIEIIGSISELDASSWNALTDGSPVLSHAFLSALEQTGCVGPGTGWQPYPLVVYEDGRLVGAVPQYAKSHSYGEYVFDWAWADAFERNGLAYYPKLLSAVPFTPVTGARLLSRDSGIRQLMVQVIADQLQRLHLSSAHVLFPDPVSSAVLEQAGWFKRHGVQFRWENEGFAGFEHFLGRLKHDKRKKIHQERNRVRLAGVSCKRLTGLEISAEDWDFFYRCYENTYLQHRSTPYLTSDFFHGIGRDMPENILLIMAERDNKPIAAALNLFGTDTEGTGTLYGRYWGAQEYVPGLHFELCYYQAQEFCIERGIRYFEGGAQGEHKLARGFKPRPTCSFHKIAHPDFAEAIEQAVLREAREIGIYHDELEEREPFRRC